MSITFRAFIFMNTYPQHVNSTPYGIVIEVLLAIKAVKNASTFSATNYFGYYSYQGSEISPTQQG
jgi:hypothetical protein